MPAETPDSRLAESPDRDSVWEWWQGLVNYERRQPSTEDLKLQRMREVLEALGNPHAALKCLHVSGTKGKGSVCAYLDSILRQATRRVALFTSPHLETINERFIVNGVPIPMEELADRIREVRTASMAIPGEPPTFFEVATAAAFLHFKKAQADWTVLETGLGGRLDSTNVCAPSGCAITSISLDHTRQLGETTELIAWEKAGILKPGVPAVSGVREPGPREAIARQAALVGAPLWEIDKDIIISNISLEEDPRQPGLWRFDLVTPFKAHRGLVPGLPGKHQVDNAALAVSLLDFVGEFPQEPAILSGLSGVLWPGRVETVHRSPWVVLDTAHNVASVQALTDTLAAHAVRGTRHLVFAASVDKDIRGMLAHLVGFFDKIHLTRYLGGQRACPPGNLLALLSDMDRARATLNENPIDCLNSILGKASGSDLVCITGSVFLAGEIKPMLDARFSRSYRAP